MEYLTNCPKCKRHSLIETVKQINHNSKRKPQQIAKCLRCGKPTRQTFIGEVERVPNYAISAQPEYSTHDRLLFKLW